MTSLTLRNEEEDPLCVVVEPLGEDYWIAPEEALKFTATTSRPEIDCIWHTQGVSVWMDDADAYGFVVTTEAGEVVECGFQRPQDAFSHARLTNHPDLP